MKKERMELLALEESYTFLCDPQVRIQIFLQPVVQAYKYIVKDNA